jgi:hypothetical protein
MKITHQEICWDKQEWRFRNMQITKAATQWLSCPNRKTPLCSCDKGITTMAVDAPGQVISFDWWFINKFKGAM